MDDDERFPSADAAIEQALDAWAEILPPGDFVDRVLAARAASAPPQPQSPPRPRRGSRVVVGIALAGAAAALAAIVLWPSHRAASGLLVASQRTTQRLGDRGIAVAEPAADVAWRVDDRGAAEIVQRAGDVFYRVERGEPFVVHTPAGDVRVTGTCFRIEVIPMSQNHKLLLAGVAGAAIAATVLVTVYEGHVIAETRSARTELPAGSRAMLSPSGDAAAVAPGTPGPATTVVLDDAHATREQLLARTRQQEVQLAALRTRLAQLEDVPVTRSALEAAEPGRLWHDPSPEKLAGWVAECHVRIDEPAIDRFSPLTEPDTTRGVTAAELDGYNAALTEQTKPWKDLVRRLYLETTSDVAGADALSSESMRREIEDKSPPGELARVLQLLSRERAGLSEAPGNLSKTSPLERLLRAYAQLGDDTEAALARHLGPDRAHAIRGDGWHVRWELGGCPGSGSP
jgi:hypothetical protein